MTDDKLPKLPEGFTEAGTEDSLPPLPSGLSFVNDDPKKKGTNSNKPGSGISSGAENYFGNNSLSGVDNSGNKSFDITQKPTNDKAVFTPSPVEAITNYVQKKRSELPFKPRGARTELSADQQEANKQIAVKTESGIPSLGEEISSAVFGKGDNSAARIQQAAEEQSRGQIALSPDKAVDLGKRINENIGMNKLANFIQKQDTPDAENIAIDIRKKNEEWNRLPIEQREEMRAWAKDQATQESQKTIDADEKRLASLIDQRKKIAARDNLLSFDTSDSGTNAAEFKKIDDEIQTLNTRIAYNKMRPDNMTARIFQNDDDVIDDLKEPAAQFLNTVKENDPTAYSRLASSLYDGTMTDSQKGEVIRGALDIRNQEIGSRIQFTKESGVFDKIKTYNTSLVEYNQKKKDIDAILAASNNNPDRDQTGQLNILKAEADTLKKKLDTYQEAGIQTDIDDLGKLDYSIDRQQELVNSSSLKYKLFEDQEKVQEATKFVEDHPVVGRIWEVLKKAAGLPGEFVKSGAEIGSQIYDKGGKLLGYDTETGAYDKLSGRFSPVEMFDALIPTQADLKVINKDGSINYSNVINGTANTLGDMAVLLAGGAKFGAVAEAAGVSSKVSGSVGLLLSSYAQTRPDYFQTAIDAGMKPADAGKFADASAILTSALELISPNEALFGKEAKNEFTKEFAKYFTKDGWKYAFEKSSERLFKEIIPENIQELSQSIGDKAVEYAANKIYNKDIFDANLSAAEVKETVLMTTLATGILTGIRNPSLNREEKQSYILEAARNNSLFQTSIDELNIKPEDKAAVSQQVEKYAKALSSIPSSVSVPTQNAIAPLLVAKQNLSEDLTKDNIDDAFKTRAKEKIKNIDEKIIGLTDGKYKPEQLNITDDPTEAAQPLPEKDIPVAAPENTVSSADNPVITPTTAEKTDAPPVENATGGNTETTPENAQPVASKEVVSPSFVREVEIDHTDLGKVNLGENKDGTFQVTYPDGSTENLSRESIRSEFNFNPDADTTSPENYDLSQATDPNYVAKLYDDKVKELEDTGSIDGAIAQYRPSFTQEEYARMNGEGIPTSVRQQYTNIAAKEREGRLLPLDTQVQEINDKFFNGEPIVSEQDVIDFSLKYPTGVDSFTTKTGNPELAAINNKYKELTGKNLRKDYAAKLAVKYNATVEQANNAIDSSEKADVNIDRMLDEDLRTSKSFIAPSDLSNEWRKQLNQYLEDPSTPFNIWNDAFEGRVLTPEEITNINKLIDERATNQRGSETGNKGFDSRSNVTEQQTKISTGNESRNVEPNSNSESNRGKNKTYISEDEYETAHRNRIDVGGLKAFLKNNKKYLNDFERDLVEKRIGSVVSDLNDVTIYHYNYSKGNAAGFFDPMRNKIFINTLYVGTKGRYYSRVVLHETLHALTVYPIYRKERGENIDEAEKMVVDELERIYQQFLDMPNTRKWYGFTNLLEFVAEAYSNRRFAQFIGAQEIEVRPQSEYSFVKGEYQEPEYSLYEKIVNAVYKFLTGQKLYYKPTASLQYVHDLIYDLMFYNEDAQKTINGIPISPSIIEKELDYKTIVQKIRNLKSSGNSLNSFGTGISKAVWDGALETVATAIEIGEYTSEVLSNAIKKAIAYVRKNSSYRDDLKVRQVLKTQLAEAGIETFPVDFNGKTDDELRNEIDKLKKDNGDFKYLWDFDQKAKYDDIETELKIREKNSIVNVSPSEAITNLQKLSESESKFISPKDLKDTLSIAEKYNNWSSLTDDQVMKNFKDSLMTSAKSIMSVRSPYSSQAEVNFSTEELLTRGFTAEQITDIAKKEFSKYNYNEALSNEKLDKLLGNLIDPLKQKTDPNSGSDLTFAEKIRQMKSKGGNLYGGLQGVATAVWDGALETIASSVELGENIAAAIKKAVDYIKSNSRIKNESIISAALNTSLTRAGLLTPENQTDLNIAEQNVRGALANYKNLNSDSLPVVERNVLKAYANLAVTEIQAGMKNVTQFAAKTGKTTEEVKDAWDMAKDAIKKNPLDPSAEIELNLPIPPAFDQMGKPVKMSIETFAEFYQRTRAWDAMNNNTNILGTPVDPPLAPEPRPTQNPGETLASWANRLNQWRMNQMPNYIASLDQVNSANNTAGPQSSFSVAPESKFEYLSRKNIDFMNRLKKVIDSIISAGGNITPETNPYTNFFFLGSKANKKNLDMLEQVVHTNEKGKKALFQQMKDDKISVNDLGMYMYAEFAPERNNNIAERRREDLAIEIDRVDAIKTQKENDGKSAAAEIKQLAALRSGKAPGFELMEDGGSGMFNDVAELIIQQFNDNGQGKLLEKYAEQFRDLVTRPELKMKLDNGLISVEEYDNIVNNGAKYIPLKVEEYYKQHRIPTVTNIKGTNKDLKKAVGSILQDYTKRVNPALAALEQYEASVVNSDKNAWITNLKNVVIDNPNYDLWEVVNPQYMPKYKADGTFVSMNEITPEQLKQESLKGFKDGKPYYIHLKDPILRRTLRGDFKTKDAHALIALRALNKVNNYFRKIQTLKNPEFIFGNVFKDIQEADFILTAKEVKGLKQSFRKGLLPAGKAIIDYQRGIRNTPATQRYENYLNSGAKITFNDFIDSQERLNNIQKDLEKHGFKGSTALQVWRKVGDFLESASEVAEVTSRFSVYNAMLEKGFTETEAAKMSRDATIDFAKKGEITHITNSLFLFMNAAAQGGYNLTKALITSSKARALYAKSAGVGLLLAAYNSAMSDDDDDDNNYWKISEYERQNNWIFKIPGAKGFLKIPMGRALSSPIYLGGQTLGMISGKLDKSEAATAVMFSFANLINPLGNTEDLVQAATPTAVRPIVQWYSNRNAFGSKIYKEGGFAENNPDSQNFFKNNSKESKAIAEWLNNNTGGSDVEKGFIDISPGTLDFGASTAFGGRGKFYKNLYDNISQIWDHNEDTKSPKIPLVGRFYTTGAPSSYESKVWAGLQESNTTKFDEKDAANFRNNLTKSLEKNEINYKEFKSLNREFMRNQLEIDIQKENPDLTKEERKALMKRIK